MSVEGAGWSRRVKKNDGMPTCGTPSASWEAQAYWRTDAPDMPAAIVVPALLK
jgi:hypothetical protein